VDPTHYEVLGVAADASPAEVRSAYRLAARDHHPDAGGDPRRMQDVNAAWHVLGDPVRRAAYDRELGRTPPPGRSNGQDRPSEPFEAGLDPDRDDLDDLDHLDPELFDSRPIGETRALTGWWALLPPGTVLAAIAAMGAAFVFRAPSLMAVAGGLLMLALGLFVLAPLRAMSRKP
jgi:curved DNA-binding protein CbpA